MKTNEDIEKKMQLIKEYLSKIIKPFQQKDTLPAYEKDKIWIYILSDPTNISLTCYVGKAKDAKSRYNRHLEPSELIKNGSNERYLHNWVISLIRRGVEPIMTILEQVPEIEYPAAERFYIAYYFSIGMELCNLTAGGEGASGYKHTNKGKEKMRQAKLGTKMSKETKAKLISQVVINNIDKIIELYKNNYSLNELGELFDVDNESIKHGLQWADINIREEKYTDRYKDKLREAQTGKTHNDDAKQKIADAHIGVRFSVETRAKMSKTRLELLEKGEVVMPTNRASGKDAGKYRDDVDDELLIKLYNAGNSLRKIGEIVNMEHHAVKERLIRSGINFESNTKKDTSNFVFDLEKALKLHNDGYSCNKIGKELNCDGKVVKKHLEKLGVVFKTANNSHKQLNDKMDKIKELYDRSFTYAEIGRMFNTSGNTIKAYLKKSGVVD